MRAVNLLPRDDAGKAGETPAAPLIAGVVTTALVLALLGGSFFLESSSVAKKKTDLDAARTELATIPAPVQPDPTLTALASEETPRMQALQQALTGRIAWDRLLREISLVLPRDVWLTSLGVQSPGATAAAAAATSNPGAATVVAPTASGFSIEGSAFSHESVARLLTRLALLPDLDNVTLGNSSKIAVGKGGAVNFTIMASIRTAGAGS